ncbi:hypothetical protein EUX98_g5228 [Antrodiella citrinella]|uniref:Uncharacterized protein n=1 Tax=Antrodiella citrinella TaxID=2447956 RepID=A0A4S4MUI0_9APHY|nr:hypothetical protein EUX98_g5228 [Antrodiella citrinella]
MFHTADDTVSYTEGDPHWQPERDNLSINGSTTSAANWNSTLVQLRLPCDDDGSLQHLQPEPLEEPEPRRRPRDNVAVRKLLSALSLDVMKKGKPSCNRGLIDNIGILIYRDQSCIDAFERRVIVIEDYLTSLVRELESGQAVTHQDIIWAHAEEIAKLNAQVSLLVERNGELEAENAKIKEHIHKIASLAEVYDGRSSRNEVDVADDRCVPNIMMSFNDPTPSASFDFNFM